VISRERERKDVNNPKMPIAKKFFSLNFIESEID